ncbi:MAG: hypothetical protein P8L66_13860 [Rhodospirillaceae bacterium]|nr:hypothetical protein [Rhodospirillaceae bacterium]
MKNLFDSLSGHRIVISLVLLFVVFLVLPLSQSETHHHLDSISADEIACAIDVLKDEGHVDDSAKALIISLWEMNKEVVLAREPSDDVTRAAFVNVRKDGVVYEARVDISAEEVLRWNVISGVQPNR